MQDWFLLDFTDNQVTLIDHTQPAEPVMLGYSR